MYSMQPQATLPTPSLEQITERIFASRRITRADQERFMQALLGKQALNEAEERQVNRIFDALQSGRLKVVD